MIIMMLNESVNNIVAINIDEHCTNHEEGNITTRKTASISFIHSTARKNCYRYSLITRTVVEWNLLPATIREGPSVDTFKARLHSINPSTHFIRNKIA